MILHFIIKDFGRVASADISLDQLVVFVGDNNSGKTMIMQLIYGLRKELEKIPVTASGAKKSELNGQNLIRCDKDWFEKVEWQVNEYLEENRQRIIENIFGTYISVGAIKIALEGAEFTYFVSSVSEYSQEEAGQRRAGVSIDTLWYERGESVKSFVNLIYDKEGSDTEVEEALRIVWGIILSGTNTLDSEQLFLPASRSGLQLLYRFYFAGETERNLVVPVKDFLRFLQLYSEDKKICELRRELLEFGEEHLLLGKVVQRGEETLYFDRSVSSPVLLHMASSMIHELTPFIKALSATQRIDWLYCDEVENSLHPMMQGEMARWVIRMVNTGMHLIISSHSDTMASRLNNLIMLTYLYQRTADYDILSELELKEADLLRTDKRVGIYEFRNGGQGKTIVEKLEFISHPLMGYDFRLFGKNLDKLYDEAERITR